MLFVIAISHLWKIIKEMFLICTLQFTVTSLQSVLIVHLVQGMLCCWYFNKLPHLILQEHSLMNWGNYVMKGKYAAMTEVFQ